MSLFDKKQEISRRDLRETLRKSSGRIPGAGGKMYSWQERVKMEKELFPYERFRGNISKQETIRRLRELRREKYQAKTGAEKLKMDRQIRYLKEISGIENF